MGVVPHMPSTALKDHTLIGSESYETTTGSSSKHETDITVLNKKISQLETKSRQKQQYLGQQWSLLLTKDTLSVVGVNPVSKT